MDTPVFERKELLSQKYGAESKLIYDLMDQQGELLSLRYDLTVPFARYLAMNRISTMKRYQIGKVYRREQPTMNKARYREFYQCDFDIAGVCDRMVPDSECIKIIAEILTKMNIGEFEIKVNHRLLLDGMFEICGVPADKFRTVSSAIDKLDKSRWIEVKRELISQRGLDDATVDRIGEYINYKGDFNLIQSLFEHDQLSKNKSTKQGLEDLKLLFRYCELLKIRDKISFDFSLARGLDYYTGVIFEAVLNDGKSVGSIAAGGRYDDLVSTFDDSLIVPCVGLSIGVERLFVLIENKLKSNNTKLRSNDTQVFVATPQRNLTEQQLELCQELWNANIKTEFSYKSNRILSQFQYCEANSIPYCVIIGEDELKANIVKLRNIESRKEETVKRESLINELKIRLNIN